MDNTTTESTTETTTQTTEAPETVTTTETTETPSTTESTTVDLPEGDSASINHPGGEASPMAERQGEIVIDKDAETPVLGQEDHPVDPVEQGKADAMANHRAHLDEQPTDQ